jgi:hypothetical protein
MGGAAKREAGLHHRLARFIGWDLPEVVAWDGSAVPLYMEVLAPMLFVEQTRGWSGLAAVMPRYLRIRDPERRAIEFLMGLSGLTRARELEAVNAELAELKANWRAAVEAFGVRVSQVGGLVQGLPQDPPADWPLSPPVVVRILHDDSWVSADDVASALRKELAAATDELPLVKQFAGQATEQLRVEEERLGRLAAQMASASRDVAEQRGELEALDVRIRAVEEDRARYQDAIRLANLGSLQHLAVADSRCPTCDQSLPHTLIGDPARPVMTLEENKQLLDGELQTFRAMRVDAQRVLTASRQKVVGLRRAVEDTRADVRSLKATLTQNGDAPSRALIERQIRLAQRIEQLDEILTSLVSLDETLGPIAHRTRGLKAELARLAGEKPTADDDAKLAAFGDSIREQLGAYGFSSWPPQEIEIAPDSYLPQRSGQTLLPTDLSASDSVRLIWAYLTGLLEVARNFETAHPGLLVFDEPGQQEISDASLRALLTRLRLASEHNQQAIIATSKSRDELNSMLDGIPATRNDYAGHVLRAPKASTTST